MKAEKTLRTRLSKKYPPDRHFFIAWGRSFALVSEILRASDLENVIDLPFSNAKHITDELYTIPYFTDRLKSHLSAFLPSTSKLKNRKIVFLDYASSGRGLMRSIEALKWYYHEVNRPIDFQFFIGCKTETCGNINAADKLGIEVHTEDLEDPSYEKLRSYFYSERLEAYTQYEPFPFAEVNYDWWVPGPGVLNPFYKINEMVIEHVVHDLRPMINGPNAIVGCNYLMHKKLE